MLREMKFIEKEMNSIQNECSRLKKAKHHLNEAIGYLNSTYFLDGASEIVNVINRLDDYIEEKQINIEELEDRKAIIEMFE